MKLEKIEIGGLKGRLLSSRVVAVFSEFNEHLTLFGSKTYDALDPEDSAFDIDCVDFQRKIRDLDRRLAFVLCQAFDDCCNLESVFKVRIVCVYTGRLYESLPWTLYSDTSVKGRYAPPA
jgi:dynein heavy chain